MKDSTHYGSVMESPCGPLRLSVDGDGVLVQIDFPNDGKVTPEPEHWVEDCKRTRAIERQLKEFFSGKREAFDLSYVPAGTDFQRAAWDAMVRIPYGEVKSYGELAAELGRPGAARAVGRAAATNPIPIVVPCHRVVGSNGSLTGFGGGLDMKQWLLQREGAWSPQLRLP